MGKRLVIAEKPSVAREIARVLDVQGPRRDGFLEGRDWVVTWAIGHLVNIAEPEQQDARWAGRWSLAQLPMIPRRFILDVLPGTKKQFEIVRQLLQREDVDDVVNATDAGREGELIFRRIYVHAGCDKAISRLWANDMTDEGLKKAFSRLMDGEEKRNLGLAAYARAEADWLVGMNYSRLFTLKAGDLVTVGRVQSPVLKILVDRRRDIEDFVPQDYWSVDATLRHGEEEFSAQWFAPPEFKESRIDDLETARALAESLTGQEGIVESVESKKGRQKAPLLYDLTSLQQEANKRHGFSAKRTLEIAQALYEQRKVLTYPRTDSRYITRELFKEIIPPFRAIYAHLPELSKEAVDRIQGGKIKFACVDDKKVSDHHAIIPTAKSVEEGDLSEDEWKVYDLVLRRFCAAFLPEVRHKSSTIWCRLGEERLKATGKIFEDRGWLEAEPWRTSKDNPLPALKKGHSVLVVAMEAKAHKTKAPSHFTDASLLGVMETAGKLIDDDEMRDAMKERGLGTPATRASIIETLVGRGYVDKKGKSLVASDKGMAVIDIVGEALPDIVSPELTGDWEKKLKDIEHGSFSYPEFMREIRKAVDRAVQMIRKRKITRALQAPPDVPEEERLGICPLCGAAVTETAKAFGCVAWKRVYGSCPFTIWKEQSGGTVPRHVAEEVLRDGRSETALPFTRRSGETFMARLRLRDSRIVLDEMK